MKKVFFAGFGLYYLYVLFFCLALQGVQDYSRFEAAIDTPTAITTAYQGRVEMPSKVRRYKPVKNEFSDKEFAKRHESFVKEFRIY
jgi:hypothetical protein